MKKLITAQQGQLLSNSEEPFPSVVTVVNDGTVLTYNESSGYFEGTSVTYGTYAVLDTYNSDQWIYYVGDGVEDWFYWGQPTNPPKTEWERGSILDSDPIILSY